ncbi:MAG: RluA family pseudouridine synthase [Acidobacteriota bacterium]
MTAAPGRWTAGAAATGQRVDSFLAETVPNQSRSFFQRLLRQGRVRVNAAVTSAHRKLKRGDQVEVDWPSGAGSQLGAFAGLSPEEIDLNIVFEDGDLLVIDKPAGLAVHPGAGRKAGTLANALAFHFQQISSEQWPDPERPGIVHRLDKPTSGLLVVAKTPEIHRRLSEQFSRRQVRKTYRALVHGLPKPEQDELTWPIGRDRHRRTRMSVQPGGRPALTAYEVEEQVGPFSLLRVDLHTGRTHQIRVHMAHAGHPVVGDAVYGTRSTRKQELALLGEDIRMFLHAARLEFRHPSTAKLLRFRSPLPAELQAMLVRGQGSGVRGQGRDRGR